MDNNQTNQPAPETPAVQPTVPQVPMTESSGESKKLILWLIIGVIIIAAIVGGIYFFLSSKPTTAPAPQANTVQIPTAAPAENLEGDINSLDVEAGVDAEFATIDQDLNQL